MTKEQNDEIALAIGRATLKFLREGYSATWAKENDYGAPCIAIHAQRGEDDYVGEMQVVSFRQSFLSPHGWVPPAEMVAMVTDDMLGRLARRE